MPRRGHRAGMRGAEAHRHQTRAPAVCFRPLGMTNTLWRRVTRAGAIVSADLGLTIAFLLAWVAPELPGSAPPAQCRQLMLVEALSIVVSALVGVYVGVARVFLPLILGALVWYIAVVHGAWHTWAVYAFTWYVVSTFMGAVAAHRGRFGNARLNSGPSGAPFRSHGDPLSLYSADCGAHDRGRRTFSVGDLGDVLLRGAGAL